MIRCYLSVIAPKTQAVAGTPKDRALISATHPVTACSILNAVRLQGCLYAVCTCKAPLLASADPPSTHWPSLSLWKAHFMPHPPFQVLVDPTYGESADQRIKRVRTGCLFPQVQPCRAAWGWCVFPRRSLPLSRWDSLKTLSTYAHLISSNFSILSALWDEVVVTFPWFLVSSYCTSLELYLLPAHTIAISFLFNLPRINLIWVCYLFPALALANTPLLKYCSPLTKSHCFPYFVLLANPWKV